MFAWAGSPLKAGVGQLYSCGGGANNNGNSQRGRRALITQIDQAADKDTQLDLSNQVDALLWDDLVTFPVFSFPGVGWRTTSKAPSTTRPRTGSCGTPPIGRPADRRSRSRLTGS